MQLIRVIKKFNSILSKNQKKGFFKLAFLMIVGALLETMSVSLIMPFMNMVMNPTEYMGKKVIKQVCDVLSIQTSLQFLVVFSLLLAVVYLAKNIYLLFEYNCQYKYVYANMLEMQDRLLSCFINRPYEYYLGVNSSEIIRVINSDTPATFDILTQLLFFFTELSVSGMMIIAVFIMSPLVTSIMAIVLLLVLFVINCIVRPILTRAGKRTVSSIAGMNKWLLQSIHGIKEVKVMSKESFFEENFHSNGKEYVKALRKKNITSVIPRLGIEGISMSSMFVIIGALIYFGESIEELIPMVSAILIAAVRLLPSVNRVSLGLASISYGEPMLDKLVENLDDINNESECKPDYQVSKDNDITNEFNKDLSLENITYQYPSAETPVLENANLVIKKGESIGIVGSSGAGKSTAVDVLLGFLKPRKGRVLLDGKNVSTNPTALLSQVGYIPQSIFILDDSIRANVAFGENEISEDAVWKAIKDASLYDFIQTLPDGIDTQIGERGVRLSGGQKQRIGIARALYHDPSILVLDEATSALDNETEKSIMESINKLHGQKTMIIIAHRLSTIENCDYVYVVKDGKIIEKRVED